MHAQHPLQKRSWLRRWLDHGTRASKSTAMPECVDTNEVDADSKQWIAIHRDDHYKRTL